MVAIGIAYLIFEKKVLAKSKLSGDSTAPADDSLSRLLVGVQVSKHRTMQEPTLTLARSGSLFWLWLLRDRVLCRCRPNKGCQEVIRSSDGLFWCCHS